MKMKKLVSFALAAAMTLSLAACGSSGGGNSASGSGGGDQSSGIEYPVRSINNIIPFGAGGGTDVWNRALMDSMGSIMGRPLYPPT